MKPRRCTIPLLRNISFLAYAGIFFLSCTSGNGGGTGSLFGTGFVDAEAFRNSITAGLGPVDTVDSLFRRHLLQDMELNVSYAYRLTEGAPLWFDAGGPKDGVLAFTEQLNDLWNEGLDPGSYHVEYIGQILRQLKAGQNGFPVDSIVQWDRTLTRAWLGAARDLLLGTREIRQADSLWFAANDTLFDGAPFLVAALRKSDSFPSFDRFRSEVKEYLQMKKAVSAWAALKQDTAYMALKDRVVPGCPDSIVLAVIRKELEGAMPRNNDTLDEAARWIALYQYYHQLKISGKNDSATLACLSARPDDYIRSLQLNMDRLRALPRTPGPEHIWVNIPLMEVNYYRDNRMKFRSRVVVGKRSRQTPTLWAPMANVVFNPPWGVPPTILRKDIGPGVSRSGPGYLARKGLRAFDAQGRDVTAMVNGANYRRFAYRQPPGARNSLGEVKFNLPNKWDIYLHDTPHRENFGNRMRALSSGCVRVQYPRLLAGAILEDRKFTQEKIDSIVQTRRTRMERLDRDLPVYIVYLTVAADSTGMQLRYLDDVYGRDRQMKKLYGH